MKVARVSIARRLIDMPSSNKIANGSSGAIIISSAQGIRHCHSSRIHCGCRTEGDILLLLRTWDECERSPWFGR